MSTTCPGFFGFKGQAKGKNLFGSVQPQDAIRFNMACGKLGCDLVAVALDKKRRMFETMEVSALASFNAVVNDLKLEGLTAPPEWDQQQVSAALKKPGSEPGRIVQRQYDGDGRRTSMQDIIVARGFKVGGLAARRVNLLAKIVNMAGTDVNSQLLETGENKFVSMSSFLDGEWKSSLASCIVKSNLSSI